MPRTPDTHITITPKHVYINGEPVCVTKDSLELSAPSLTEAQTVTLTIRPTTVTILNDDDPDTINATREAVTRTTREEADNNYSIRVHADNIADILNAWKLQ